MTERLFCEGGQTKTKNTIELKYPLFRVSQKVVYLS